MQKIHFENISVNLRNLREQVSYILIDNWLEVSICQIYAMVLALGPLFGCGSPMPYGNSTHNSGAIEACKSRM